ncbi:DPP IV N-terminal domain-containing protein [bacterium]|nr:DPP IV N-terminal domain-containing protein [bacterium]
MKKTISIIFGIFFILGFSSVFAGNNVIYVTKSNDISNLTIYDIQTGKAKKLTHFQDIGEIHSTSVNETGDTILFTRPSPANGRNNSTIWSINTDGSGLCDQIKGEFDLDFKYAGISPDGTQIVYSKNSISYPDIYHLYLKTPTETRWLSSGISNVRECAYPFFINDNQLLFLIINNQDKKYDYYSINTNGTGLTNLTKNNKYSPYFPKLGRPYLNNTKNKLIYGKQMRIAGEYTKWQINILDISTSLEEVVFNNLSYPNIHPDNQPDPQPFFKDGEIGFIGTQNGTVFNLYFSNVNATNPYLERKTCSKKTYLPTFFTTEEPPTQWVYESAGRVIVRDENSLENDITSGYSPIFNWKGTSIAFKDNEIKMKRLGGAIDTIIDTSTTSDFPAFSPDGKWLAYIKNNDIWAQPIDLSNPQQQLTNSPFIEKQDLSFSPDGRYILYTGIDNNNKIIYKMPISITYETTPLINSVGLPVNLTSNTSDNYNPSFSPDGLKIAFISTKNQHPELWIMDSDGRNQQKIIFSYSAPTNPSYPQFSPYNPDIIAYLTDVPSKVFTVDISQEIKQGNLIYPQINTSNRFSYAKTPSGNIDIKRNLIFDTYCPGTILKYTIDIGINSKLIPTSFLVEETIPDIWIVEDVKINGVTSSNIDITTSGDKQTIRWLFGSGDIYLTDSQIELTLNFNGDSLGNQYWLTGGLTVFDKKYLTTGDSHISLGEPYIPVDTNTDWKIDSLELLETIDLWADNQQIKGWPINTEDWDFLLLKIISFWVNEEAGGYRYKTGGNTPDWEIVP